MLALKSITAEFETYVGFLNLSWTKNSEIRKFFSIIE